MDAEEDCKLEGSSGINSLLAYSWLFLQYLAFSISLSPSAIRIAKPGKVNGFLATRVYASCLLRLAFSRTVPRRLSP